MKLIFDKSTGRGKDFGRDAKAGEFAVDLPLRDCRNYFATPERYLLVDGALAEFPGWGDELAALQASVEQLELEDIARQAALEQARKTSGVHKYTPEQLTQYITNQIDGAGTVAQVKEVVKNLLINMAVHILK